MHKTWIIFAFLALSVSSLVGCSPAQTEGPVELSEEEAQEVMNQVNAAGTQEENVKEN